MLWKDFDNIKRHRYHVILWTVFQTFSSVGLHLPMHLKFRKRYKPTAVHKIWCVCFGGTLKMWIISPTSVSSQQERKIIIHFEILYMYLGCLSRSDVDFTENCSLIEKWSKGRWIWKILILPPTWFHTASFPKRLCFGRDGRREYQEQATLGKWLFFSSNVSPGCHGKAILLQHYRVLNLNVLCLNSVMQMRIGLYSSLFICWFHSSPDC